MGLLTQRGYYEILDRAFDTGGLTEDMQKDLMRLKGELDERDGLLRRYGETYDGESEEREWEFRERPVEDYESRYREAQGKLEELTRRYNERFYNPPDSHDTDTILDTGEQVLDRNSADITMDELFTERG